MEKLPKLKEFKAPAGYFDQLPDQIMDSVKPNKRNTWLQYAATIVLILSVGIWLLFSPEISPQEYSLDDEVSLYIDSQYWTAEDVLSMTENPDEILDQIINEEIPEDIELWGEEEQIWF
jgi:hypothetical protein